MHANDLGLSMPKENAKGNKNEQQWKPHKDPLSFLLLQINCKCYMKTHKKKKKTNFLTGSNIQTKQKDCFRDFWAGLATLPPRYSQTWIVGLWGAFTLEDNIGS